MAFVVLSYFLTQNRAPKYATVMSSRTTMSISLPAVLKEWVDMQVEARGYGTASEYIREMIRREREVFVPGGNTPENRRRIHDQIEEGWRQSEQGLGRDSAEVFAEIRERLNKGSKGRHQRKTGSAR